MKLKKAFAIIIVCTVLLTGCNNDKQYSKMMDEATQEVSKQEYKQALDSLQEALDNKKGDKEATALYEQVEKLIQVIAKKDAKMYEQAISLCDEILKIQSKNTVVLDAAKRIKNECISLKEEAENSTFKESIHKRIEEVTECIDNEDYMSAKTKLSYIVEEISNKSGYDAELKQCETLLNLCDEKLDELSKKEEDTTSNDKDDDKDSDKNSNKDEDKDSDKNESSNNSQSNSNKNEEEYVVEFNDELKQQIANAGANYIEFYFEYGKDQGKSPKEFAEQAFEDTENDTPLGEYKDQARVIFVDAFKKAFEETGNKFD